MKILHITATHLNEIGGLPTVLHNLINSQNLLPGVESRLLSVKANSSAFENNHFDFLAGSSFGSYLDSFKPDVAIIHGF